MKKLQKFSLYLIMGVLLLSGCGKVEHAKNDQNNQPSNRKTVTTGKNDKDSYQAILEKGRYRENKNKDVSGSALNNVNYNKANYESGLIRLSQEAFPTDQYYFQEGQKISKRNLENWVGRKSDQNPDGLNPADENAPILLQKVIEYDFIDMKKQQLSGVSIGLVLNSTYYKVDQTSVDISDEQLVNDGKAMADQIVKRMRGIKGLENIPVTISLFKQADRNNIAGGDYLYTTTVDSGDAISKWKDVNEKHVVLGMNEDDSVAKSDGLEGKYNDFKKNIQDFFPNLSGVSGIAFYRNDNLENLWIDIETKYSSKTEVTSFTQFVAKQAETSFDVDAAYDIQIHSLDETQGFVAKKEGDKSVYSHVFY